MVFNGLLVVEVAKWSAEACQYIAFNPEMLSNSQVFDILICLPFRNIGTIAICIFSCLCCNRRYFNSSDSSDSSSDEEDDDDDDDGDVNDEEEEQSDSDVFGSV